MEIHLEDLAKADAPPNAIWLDSLDVNLADQGWGAPRAGRSVINKPMALKGVVYAHGLGTHASPDYS